MAQTQKPTTDPDALRARLLAKRKARAEKVAEQDPKDLPVAAPQPAQSKEAEELKNKLRAAMKQLADAKQAEATTQEDLNGAKENLAKKGRELAGAKADLAQKTRELVKAQADSVALGQRVSNIEGDMASKGALDELKDTVLEIVKELKAIKGKLWLVDRIEKESADKAVVESALSAGPDEDYRKNLYQAVCELGAETVQYHVKTISVHGEDEVLVERATQARDQWDAVLVAGAFLQDEFQEAVQNVFTQVLGQDRALATIPLLLTDPNDAVKEVAKQFTGENEAGGS